MAAMQEASVVAAGGDDGVVRLWTLSSRGLADPIELPGHGGPVRAAAFSPTGATLVTGGADGTVRFWDTDRLEEIVRARQTHSGPVRALAMCDGQVAVVGPGREVLLCDGESGEVTRRLRGMRDWPMAVCVFKGDSGESCIAAAGDDRAVRVWDQEDRPVGSLLGHTRSIRALCVHEFGPGALRLVSGALDGTVRVWDPWSSEPQIVIRLGVPVHALASIDAGVVAGTQEGHLVIGLRDLAGHPAALPSDGSEPR
jgi:WD40 repeat protein